MSILAKMTTTTPSIDVRFPPKLKPLFMRKKWRNIVFKGGRGSGKSWGVARALLILGTQEKLRVLCTREVQLSIKDSVHRLLRDQIDALGLGAFYQVLDSEIRGINGTLFLFSGLSSHTVDSVKSFEGVNITWVEEGQTISKRSWDILIPTVIRTENPSIIITMNPELETQATWQRFIAKPRRDTLVVDVNYKDNPWFPEAMEQERLEAQRTLPKHEYDWIWEGKLLPAAEGAIYHSEVTAMRESGRIRYVPFDPLLKTHTVWDLGFNDSMAIIIAQRVASEIRIVHYIEDNKRTAAQYVQQLNALSEQIGQPINWGYDFLPHDGFHRGAQTGLSFCETLERLGRKVYKEEAANGVVRSVPNVTIEDGIRVAREVFPRVFIDEECADLIECLKNYKRQLNQKTNTLGSPVHDNYSHGADAFRYLSLVADKMTNEEVGTYEPLNYQSLGAF